ncbi:MAG TPA: SoxR reducing system RseC family protein [Woeseiaceae bacterium]|jgi:positive regulator of sigma E activity|nr:SoxR reducing system RseC family protein [Woeseiaceae bacterium]
MDSPTGTVIGILHAADGQRVTVELDKGIVCARCASGKGCGAGLWPGSERSTQIEAVAHKRSDLAVGDTVQLKLPPSGVFAAALHAYGAPLLGVLIAVAVAQGMAFGDVEAAAASLAGLAVGSFASRLYLNRPSCLSRLQPRIDKVL